MINNKFEAKETCFPLLFLSLIEILILLQILVLC